jgi:hypothetical protein
MTKIVNLCEDTKTIAFGELNIGDTFESRGKIYIKYYDDDCEETFGLQIYPSDSSQFHCDVFAADEFVSERVCTITIE